MYGKKERKRPRSVEKERKIMYFVKKYVYKLLTPFLAKYLSTFKLSLVI